MRGGEGQAIGIGVAAEFCSDGPFDLPGQEALVLVAKGWVAPPVSGQDASAIGAATQAHKILRPHFQRFVVDDQFLTECDVLPSDQDDLALNADVGNATVVEQLRIVSVSAGRAAQPIAGTDFDGVGLEFRVGFGLRFAFRVAVNLSAPNGDDFAGEDRRDSEDSAAVNVRRLGSAFGTEE